MTDTPRVTVPVDGAEVTITLTGKVSDTMPDRPGWFRVTGHKFIFSATGDDAAIQLSAAPAPEGGAVMRAEDAPVWADGIVTDGERVSMAQKAEADHGGTYWAVDGGDGGLDWEPTHFVSLSALATREEAPAEAGERECGWCDGRKTKQTPSTDFTIPCPYCKGTGKEVLRAQPPAREDAQPVAKPAPFNPGGIGHAMYQAFNVYLADYVLSTDGADYEPTPFERDLIEDFFAGLMAEEAFFGPVRALYDTHPAPDALRVAVEALEPFAYFAKHGTSREYINSDAPDDGLCAAASFPAGAYRGAVKALAALQAEQGAK